MNTFTTTPRHDGFRIPAEFEPHSSTWILWPERPDNWRNNAKPAQQAFAAVAKAISDFEQVKVGAVATQISFARQQLPPNIEVFNFQYDDAWARDTGPTWLVNNTNIIRGVDWRFNSWGAGIFPSWEKDDLVARQILEYEGLDRYKAEIVLEGGAINTDGEGTLLTTEECLLNPNRNPKKTKAEIEHILTEYLNVRMIIWLKRGVYLDEAGGHIDNLCSFVRPGVVALSWTNDKADPQYDISAEAYEILSSSIDAVGRKLEIHKVIQPNPMYITKEEVEGLELIQDSVIRKEGDRLPGSYINFYIVNGGVIMPFFRDRQDEKAQQALQCLFPNRKVVGVYSRELLLGGGAIHCIAQQVPINPYK